MKRPKAKGHKKQHFVAESYLKAWCDPQTPAGQTPYVWRFNKDGSDPRRKAPENLFRKTDLYTIHGPDGGRDLTLEHGLAGLESEFVRIRDSSLANMQMISPVDHVLLCAFMAAAHARTPAQRDHLGGQWATLLEKMDRMREWAKTATPEQKRLAAPLDRTPRSSLSYDDVKTFAKTPMQTMLPTIVRTEAPLLARLDFLVLTSSVGGFITSDSPCVRYDPEAYRRPPLYQAPALMYESIEISLPVSPRQLIVLNRRGLSGYGEVRESIVDEFNRRTRFYCSEYFVNNVNQTKPVWFDPGVAPADSWKRRPRLR
jgi:hypothetical protein